MAIRAPDGANKYVTASDPELNPLSASNKLKKYRKCTNLSGFDQILDGAYIKIGSNYKNR